MSSAPELNEDLSEEPKVGFASGEPDIIFLDPEDMIDDENSGDYVDDEFSNAAEEDELPVAGERGEVMARPNLEEITRDVESISGYVIKKKEETRGVLALTYIRASFLVFFLGFLVSILDGVINQTSIVANLEKLLPLISGIFLGTLGFVIGYYFRKDEEGE